MFKGMVGSVFGGMKVRILDSFRRWDRVRDFIRPSLPLILLISDLMFMYVFVRWIPSIGVSDQYIHFWKLSRIHQLKKNMPTKLNEHVAPDMFLFELQLSALSASDRHLKDICMCSIIIWDWYSLKHIESDCCCHTQHCKLTDLIIKLFRDNSCTTSTSLDAS